MSFTIVVCETCNVVLGRDGERVQDRPSTFCSHLRTAAYSLEASSERHDTEQDLRKWLMELVGSASSLNSAKSIIERLVEDALKANRAARTASGRLLTDEDFEKLADEAQKGHPDIERTIGNTDPKPGESPKEYQLRLNNLCRCWNEGQWGRVHREDCPIHGKANES